LSTVRAVEQECHGRSVADRATGNTG
jgi:hypothetical protein